MRTEPRVTTASQGPLSSTGWSVILGLSAYAMALPVAVGLAWAACPTV